MAEAARQEDWPRTIEEFEVWRARQQERWEFIDGQPRLMAPASIEACDHQGQRLCRALRRRWQAPHVARWWTDRRS